jgi:hypothetical protein
MHAGVWDFRLAIYVLGRYKNEMSERMFYQAHALLDGKTM